VIAAIKTADTVLLAPSNPITSIGPILAVPGIRDTLRETRAKIAAVSPIVGGAAVAGPAGALMQAQGLPVSIAGVAEAYHDFLDLLVVDNRDVTEAAQLRARGFHLQCTNTIMKSAEDKAALARAVMAFAAGKKARSATETK